MHGSKPVSLILPTLLISTSLSTANMIAPAAFPDNEGSQDLIC